MAGFWTGRSLQWQLADTEEGIAAREAETADTRGAPGARHARGVRRIPVGHEIGSPVSGSLSCASENGQSVLRLAPDRGRVYAPAAGRILRLYPMGCAMLLRTDFGADLYLQAGSGADEMQSGCYRCRVMEREVVRKGSLLLEYDLEGLHRDGAGTEVTLRVVPREREETPMDVTVTDRPYVKAGDCVMHMR